MPAKTAIALAVSGGRVRELGRARICSGHADPPRPGRLEATRDEPLALHWTTTRLCTCSGSITSASRTAARAAIPA